MNDNEINKKILSFEVYGQLNEYIDSILFDYGKIASLKINKYMINIEIIGDKKIIFNGNTYKSACNYPKELIEIIKQGAISENSNIEIIDNNWFEMDIYEKCSNNQYELIFDDVLDIDISKMTNEMLKQYLFDSLNDYVEGIENKEYQDKDIDMEMEVI